MNETTLTSQEREKNRELKQKLQANIEDALQVLLPFFAIHQKQALQFRKPSYVISSTENATNTLDYCRERGSYNFETAEFTFNPTTIENIATIGEETAHYIHGEINPLWKDKPKTKEEYFKTANLVELIGRYGALVYTQEKKQKVEPINWYDVVTDGSGLEVGQTHYEGYTRAEKIFKEQGAKLLPKIARMSFEESRNELPKIAPIHFYEPRLYSGLQRMIKKII